MYKQAPTLVTKSHFYSYSPYWQQLGNTSFVKTNPVMKVQAQSLSSDTLFKMTLYYGIRKEMKPIDDIFFISMFCLVSPLFSNL